MFSRSPPLSPPSPRPVAELAKESPKKHETTQLPISSSGEASRGGESSNLKRRRGSSPSPLQEKYSKEARKLRLSSPEQAAGTQANLEFDDNAPHELKAIAPLIVGGLGKRFPQQYNTVRIVTSDNSLKDDAGAETSVSKQSKSATIKITKIPNGESANEKQAKYALTLVHEMYLHAIPDLIAVSQNKAVPSELEQHRTMFTPGTIKDNSYYHAIMSVHKILPKPIQDKFLNEYLKEVYLHADEYGTPNEADAINSFMDELYVRHNKSHTDLGLSDSE
jgi:hypothetical protein